MISERQIIAILEGFAVGDAMGMPTEFMTRSQIAQEIGTIESLVESRLSAHHSDLPQGSVTDDTEQTLSLLSHYLKRGVTIESTVEGLLAWIDESDAVAKRYIGPSSLKALRAIQEGADPMASGSGGTTCGGLMRSLAPTLYALSHAMEWAEMLDLVVICLIPTHYTSQALEAACAYSAAIACAVGGGTVTDIIEAARTGGEYGLSKAPYVACSASSIGRLDFIVEYLHNNRSEEELLDLLYYVLGTGLESADIFAALFAFFLFSPGDAFRSICLAAQVGGDTDTIAALVGGLNRAFNIDAPIPPAIVEQVRRTNDLPLESLARSLVERGR